MEKTITSIKRFIIPFLIIFFLFSGIYHAEAASTNVPLHSWVYLCIEKIASMGYVQDFMGGILPLTRIEVAQYILGAKNKHDKEGVNPYIEKLLTCLEREFKEEMDIIRGEAGHINYVKPAGQLYFEHIFLSERKDMENESGRVYGDDSNFQSGITTRGEVGNHFAFFIHPEVRVLGNELGTDVEFIEAYGKFSRSLFELEVGRDTMWWGQGRHGSLHLTNNAPAFKFFKLSTTPFVFHWLFKISFFTAELEEMRPNPAITKPKFSGIKLSMKPHPIFEIGITRTFLYEDMSDFFNALIAKDENTINGPGNQQAGFDWRLTLPLKIQPITLYGEHGGEDEAGGLPSVFAHLWGIYLPQILGIEALEFRMEYANTHDNEDNKPRAWYTHSASQEGFSYMYKNRVMGHHMGTDADDLFLSFSYVPNPALRLSFSFDRERHDISLVEEKKNEYTLSVSYWPKEFLRLYGEIQSEKIDSQGVDDNNLHVKMGIAFIF